MTKKLKLRSISSMWSKTLELAVETLCSGGVIGFFQGRSEIGPRALGHRSILANPSYAAMKDWINGHVKFREAWRPYAPIVVQECVLEWIDIPESKCYEHMMLSGVVREGHRNTVGAIAHVDGTTRPQVVYGGQKSISSRLTDVLLKFHEETGIPMLLNTSFNGREEPIVETPQDATKMFAQSELNGLVLGDYYIEQIKK